MTIVFSVNADGSVQSSPALIPQGVSVDVVVVSPFTAFAHLRSYRPTKSTPRMWS